MVKAMRIFALLLTLSFLLTGCASMAPKGKTIMLVEEETQEAEENAETADTAFEATRVVPVLLDKIDPDALHPDAAHAVSGFSDNERVFVMSVHLNSVSSDKLPESSVEQQTERVVTQFGTLNYQYGFFDPALTLTDVSAECYDVSQDGRFVAITVGNTLYVYRVSDGTFVQTQTRDMLVSRVTFGLGSTLYFTTGGEDRSMEAMNVETGETRKLLADKSYRVLATDDATFLLTVVSQGSEEISLLQGGNMHSGILTGDKSGNAYLLPDGTFLLQYGDDLYTVKNASTNVVMHGISAFTATADGGHIAYALRNADGTVDVCVAGFSLGVIVDDTVAYKNVGLSVSSLLLSEDRTRLYVQGTDESGTISALVIQIQ